MGDFSTTYITKLGHNRVLFQPFIDSMQAKIRADIKLFILLATLGHQTLGVAVEPKPFSEENFCLVEKLLNS